MVSLILLILPLLLVAHKEHCYTDARAMGDIRERHFPSPEDAPYMAAYITCSRINYPRRVDAEAALEAIRSGRLIFAEEMQRQAEENRRNSRNKEHHQSGNLGLLAYDQLDPVTSRIVFDIRRPTSKTPNDIIGPICTDYGCSIFVVFSRYRASFFSREWHDVEQWCVDNNMDIGQFLQLMNTDDIKTIVASVWPHDTVVFRKLKLQQVAADLERMKSDDPSTRIIHRPKSTNQEYHRKLMEERKKFFNLFITQEIIDEHPEVYALELDDIMRSGWIPKERLEEHGYAPRPPEEDTYRSSMGGGGGLPPPGVDLAPPEIIKAGSKPSPPSVSSTKNEKIKIDEKKKLPDANRKDEEDEVKVRDLVADPVDSENDEF